MLSEVKKSVLKINTFGSSTMKKVCGITTIKLWNRNGIPHSYTVTKIDSLTESIQRSSLTSENKKFLFDNEMPLSIGEKFDRTFCLDVGTSSHFWRLMLDNNKNYLLDFEYSHPNWDIS
ncbi:unnamed protein product [Heligmosomoides polygyrus]|uniref:PLAT domain-containing protein n=1 Tax=Heligmosomoides polygyrus TaxID=6339 RepID=A0A183GWJ8_HELPZ|nr:unnamed protein product [Heligmosomoides polygyrus]